MRASLVILVLLTLTAAIGPAPAQGEGGVRFERWYRVERDGAPIGWMSMIERSSDGVIVTEATYEERVLVMGQTRHLRVFGEVHEDPGGRVMHVSRSRNQDARLPANAFATPADQIEPGGAWNDGLGPSAAAAFIARRLEAGAARLSVVRMGPLLMDGAEQLTLTGIHACSRIIDGREIEGFCADWGDGGSVMLDARGYPIVARFADGSRTVVFSATSREDALSPFEPVETVADVLVPVTPQPWDGRAGSFVVERLDAQAWTLPDTLGDFAYSCDGERMRSTTRHALAASLDTSERDAALRETGLINFSQLPRLGWVNDVVGTPADARARFAHRRAHDRILHKGFALGLADAATSYLRREGDCTEHAVLLAAMLRSERIPARVVGGLVPVELDGRIAMTQHLWVQAFIERDGKGVWKDLDATLAPGSLQPPRIALGATGVTDDSVEDLVRRLGSLAGLLRVEVLPPE